LALVTRATCDVVGAEAEYRTANALDRLDPKHVNKQQARQPRQLSVLLKAKGNAVVAETENRTARPRPEARQAHFNLGILLENKGGVVGAEAEYRTALALDPKHVNAHCNPGVLLENTHHHHHHHHQSLSD
jgi:hypothetical protein